MRRIGITLSLFALLLAALALPGGASASHLSRADFKSVSKYCKALRSEMGAKSFKRAFGKGKHKRRAQRRCVARRGVIPKVTLRSTPPPVECPPASPPAPAPPAPVEPPLPVRAFAVDACAVELPAPVSTQPVGDEDDEAEERSDQDSDDDESDDDESGSDDDRGDDDRGDGDDRDSDDD